MKFLGKLFKILLILFIIAVLIDIWVYFAIGVSIIGFISVFFLIKLLNGW